MTVKTLLGSMTAILLSMQIATHTVAQTYEQNGQTYSVEASPRWVKSYEAPNKLRQSEGSVDYLLVEKQFKTDTRDNYYRFVERPLSLEGLESVSKLEVDFNPEYESLTWHQINIIRNGKVIQSLDPAQIQLLRKEDDLDQDMLNGYVTSLVYLKGTRLNDIVDYSFSIKGRNPIFADHFFRSFALNWVVPVARSAVRIVTPESQPLFIRNHHYQGEPLQSRENGYRVYEWQVADVNTYYYEDDYPTWYEPEQYVSVTDFPDWKAVVDWAVPLYQQPPAESEELSELISRLKQLPPREAIRQALAFSQNEIRYVGIELGKNSHLPHSPAETLANRYGDCKDKTLLLVTLLNAIDIKAYPALVSWDLGAGVANYAPSPSPFDHVITMVEFHNQIYWLDPTRRYQEGDLDVIGYHDFGKALPIYAGNDSLIDMVLPEASMTSIKTVEDFYVYDYYSPVDHEIVTTYTGAEADYMRRLVATNSRDSLSNDFLNYMAKIYPGISFQEKISVADDKLNNKLILTEKYRINDYFSADKGTLEYDTYAYSLNSYLPLPKVTRRQGPTDLNGPVLIEHDIHVHYPEPINMALENPRVSHQSEGVQYSLEMDYLNRTLSLKHQLKVNRPWLEADDVQSYVKGSEEIKNELSQPFLLDDTPAKESLGQAFTKVLGALHNYVGNKVK